MTDSIKKAIHETNRRREIQTRYNEEHGITPKGIQKKIDEILDIQEELKVDAEQGILSEDEKLEYLKLNPYELGKRMKSLKKEMLAHSDALEFEEAARIRDLIHEIEAVLRARQ